MNKLELYEKVKKLEKSRWEVDASFKTVYKQMVQVLNEILSINAKDEIALTNLGAITSDIGRHEEALEILRKVEKMEFQDYHLYQNIGIAMMNISPITRKNAKGYFEKSIKYKKNPWTFLAYFDPYGY